MDEKVLSDALSTVEYTRVKKGIYRANWSNEHVEHFLFFTRQGGFGPKNFLHVDFCLKNKSAHDFGLKYRRRYILDSRSLKFEEGGLHCPMRFPLGRLAGWGLPASLNITSAPFPDLALRIASDIRAYLYPVVRHVTTAEALLSLFLPDQAPCNWFYVNAATRAAQIVDLARQTGADVTQIRMVLEAHKKAIAGQLGRDADPEAFIDEIINDAMQNGWGGGMSSEGTSAGINNPGTSLTS